MICAVEGCERLVDRRIWCGMHYRRFIRNGDASITKKAANGAGYSALGYTGRQIGGVRKFDHVRIAELAIGKALPMGAVVHHVNEIRSDNRNENLVICQNRAYHNLIHARTDAYNACGDPSFRKCRHCKQYDSLENLACYEARPSIFQYWHKLCASKSAKQRRLAK